LRILNAKGVEYLLIGDYAIGYHGYPRTTRDMDIWIAAHANNAERMDKALREFGFQTPELSPDLFLKENSIVRMGGPPMRIEVLTTICGVVFEECYSARVIDEIDGVPVNIISLQHLKTNNRASGRHRDLDDLERLP